MQEQTADLVVVSSAAIESSRLLLNSKSRLFPNGLGNRYDWVGRNLQGHAYTGAIGLFDRETYDDLGPGASIAVCELQPREFGIRERRAAGERVHSSALPVCFPQCGRNPWLGAGHKDFMRRYNRSSISVMGPMQEMPVFDSRVQVDPKVKDHWGIPGARLCGHRHPNDLWETNFMFAKAEAWLKEVGATTVIRSGPISLEGPSGHDLQVAEEPP